MKPNIIVGGGLSGLLTARILQDRNISFLGLEKSSRLGGRAEAGPHRVLLPKTVNILEKLAPSIRWISQDEECRERVKGDYQPLKDSYSDEENFYLRSSHHIPSTSFEKVVNEISVPIADKFLLNKNVVRINATTKTLELADGTEQPYENLFWCSDFGLLFKSWNGEPLHAPKGQKKNSSKPAGFNLTLDLEGALFDAKNTVVLPFRFKEYKLRALAVSDWSEDGLMNRLHWMVFLPKEVMDDREEVAKCVRTLKRELSKEFPELSAKTKREKIVYLPLLSGEQAVSWGSIEVGPGVFYVGPQVYLTDEQAELKNLDLLVSNVELLRNKEFATT